MTATGSSDASCQICALEEAAKDRVIFRDRLWAAEVAPGSGEPGWFILRSRRHAEHIVGLTADELVSFGPRIRDLVEAVRVTTKAPTTYLLSFGESNPHFHVLVIARTDQVPEDRRGAQILQWWTQPEDGRAVLAVASEVRTAYESIGTANQPSLDV